MGSKIIYIAGLGHSGSTILDMSLGTLPGVVGLGELKTLMDDHTRERHYTSVCSCGDKATECIIWKEVPGLLTGKRNDPEKIEAMLDLLRKRYGNKITLADSSKNSYGYLKYLHEKHDLRVIYLTRDIRSWSYSRHLSTGKPVIYFLLRWVLENIKLRSQIRKMGIRPMKAGYEELALFPEHVLKRIAAFADLEYSESMLTPGLTNSHIISGNVARVDIMKRMHWRYDARWMLSPRIMLLSPLFLLLHRMNSKLVFSQVNRRSLKDFYMFGTQRKKEISETHN
ncbi:MAG: hypothetical protein WD577_07605 [Bacteroidales bacterium]